VYQNTLNGFTSVGCFPSDLNGSTFFEQGHDALSNELVAISYEDAYFSVTWWSHFPFVLLYHSLTMTSSLDRSPTTYAEMYP
jgi:hypothetical protein